MADSGAAYRCIVSGKAGRVTSYEAILTVMGGDVAIDTLMWIRGTSGIETPRLNRSISGNPLRVHGQVYEKGIGTHAPSEILYRLQGRYSAFHSRVGLDEEEHGSGSVCFQVWLDGQKAYDSGTLKGSQTGDVRLDTRGKQEMRLIVTDAGDGPNSDHADWAGAALTVAPDSSMPNAASSPKQATIKQATVRRRNP